MPRFFFDVRYGGASWEEDDESKIGRQIQAEALPTGPRLSALRDASRCLRLRRALLEMKVVGVELSGLSKAVPIFDDD
jgi:hypothetical protein